MPSAPRTFDFGPLGNQVVGVAGVLVAALCLALSLWSTWLVASLAHDVWRARNWPQVQANVMHASLSIQGAPRRLGYYASRVKYRYLQGGRQYDSGRLVFSGQTGETIEIWNGQWLAKVVSFLDSARLSGRPIQVFANPADPSDAVVFRDMVWGNYVMRSLLMILLSAFPLGIAAFYLPRRLKPRAVRLSMVVLALLYPAIALAGAALAAAA